MIAVSMMLIIDCSPDEVADAVNEILRERQRTYAASSCLVDYSLGPAVELQQRGYIYEEGDAFCRY